jgi:hypothetical protein
MDLPRYINNNKPSGTPSAPAACDKNLLFAVNAIYQVLFTSSAQALASALDAHWIA